MDGPSQFNLLPDMIAAGSAIGASRGTVHGSVMAADIVGFTALTERLRAQGERGTERLGDILSGAHQLIGQAVAEMGGSVVAISGDGLLALFPDDEGARAAFAACQVRDALARGIEGQPLELRCGLATGEVHWTLFRAAGRAAYGLEGDAILAASRAETAAGVGAVVADAKLSAALPDVFGLPDAAGFSTLKGLPSAPRDVPHSHLGPLSENLNSALWPFEHHAWGRPGEFREVISAFIRLPDHINPVEKQNVVETILDLSAARGGTGWRLEQGASGLTFFLYWGAPVAHEHDLQRAFGTLRALIARSPVKLAIGASVGLTYAGFVGTERFADYACLGASTNLAARLAHRAPFGAFWIDPTLANRVDGRVPLREIGKHSLKGFKGEITVQAVEGDFTSKGITGRTELVGRGALRAELLETFSSLVDGGRAGGVILEGEPGIGKSHLADDVVQSLPEEILCLRADTNPVLRPSLGAAWELLRQAVADRAALRALVVGANDPALEATLVRSAPLLAEGLGFDWVEKADPDLDAEARLRLSRQGISAALRVSAESRPVLLHIEDIHWLDDDSRAVVTSIQRSLTSEASASAIGLLMTARPREQHLPSDAKAEIRKLERLDRAAIADLLTALLNGPPSARLVSVVEDRSAGVALFVTQLVRYLQDTDVLELVEGFWHLADRFETQRLPADARALLTSRIDRLPEEARRTVAIAAVLEGAVSTDQVAAVATEDGEPLPEPADALNAAVSANILSRSDAGFGFSHALLRDAAYEMLLPSRRVHLHQVAARLLENAGAGPAVLALHFDRGELAEQAIGYHLKAGEEADAAFQNEAGIWHYGRALDLIPEADLRLRFETAIALERLLSRTSDHTRQERIIDVIDALAEGLTERDALVAGVTRAEYLNDRSRLEECISILEDLQATAEKYPGTELCVGLYRNLAMAYSYVDIAGHWKTGLDHAKSAVKHAVATGDTEIFAEAKSLEAMFYRYRDDPKAEKEYRAALEHTSDPVLTARILHRLGSIAFRNGNRQEGYDLYDRTMEIAEKTGDIDRKGHLALGYAFQAEREGNITASIARYRDAMASGKELNAPILMKEAERNLANIASNGGRLSESDAMFRKISENPGPDAAIAAGTLSWHCTTRAEWAEAEILLSRYEAWALELNYQSSMLQIWTARLLSMVLQQRFTEAQDILPKVYAAEEIFDTAEAYGQNMDPAGQRRINAIQREALEGLLKYGLGEVGQARSFAESALAGLVANSNAKGLIDVSISGLSPGSHTYALAHDLLSRLGHPGADRVVLDAQRRLNELADRFVAAGYPRECIWNEDRFRAYLMERAPGQPGRTLIEVMSDQRNAPASTSA